MLVALAVPVEEDGASNCSETTPATKTQRIRKSRGRFVILFFFFQIDRTIRSIDRFDEINFVLGCAECRGVTRLTPTTVESDVTMKMADWDG